MSNLSLVITKVINSFPSNYPFKEYRKHSDILLLTFKGLDIIINILNDFINNIKLFQENNILDSIKKNIFKIKEIGLKSSPPLLLGKNDFKNCYQFIIQLWKKFFYYIDKVCQCEKKLLILILFLL